MKKQLGYVAMVIGSVISVGFNVLSGLQIAQTGLSTPYWMAIGLSLFFVGVFAVLHYQNIENEEIKKTKLGSISSITLQPKAKLSWNDQIVIQHLGNQMERIHGHSDLHGIESDYQKGIDTNDILKRNCLICGKPRNEIGGYVP